MTTRLFVAIELPEDIQDELAAQGAGQFISAKPADVFEIGADSGSLVGGYGEDNGFKGTIEGVQLYWGEPGADLIAKWSKE